MNPNDLVKNGCYHYLSAYADFIKDDFQRPEHIQTIIKALSKIESGEIKRLMINVPPRFGKSYLVSTIFPTWYLGKNPDKNIIFSTYGQSLADDFGRQVRNIVQDEKFGFVFPNVKLADDSASVKKFAVSQGGIYYAIGAGGSLTGKGGSLIILDDVIRNRADANSDTIRKNILDWYKSTLYTRLAPGGSIVFINTRWHESDLAGHLLKSEPELWTHLNMPAISDDGHSLWPERWPLDKLEEIKKSIGSYEWAALYQQRPSPAEGGMFNKAWFEIINAMPKGNIVGTVRYWDRAATIKKDGNDPDYTAGVKISKDRNGIFYIEDVIRIRASSLDVQKTIQNTASRDGQLVKIVLEQDPGQAGKSEVEYLIRLLQGYNVKANRVSKDKITRASPFSAQCEAGNVKLLRGKWNEAFLDELEMFPNGTHDDQVDAVGQGFMELTLPGLNYENLVRM